MFLKNILCCINIVNILIKAIYLELGCLKNLHGFYNVDLDPKVS